MLADIAFEITALNLYSHNFLPLRHNADFGHDSTFHEGAWDQPLSHSSWSSFKEDKKHELQKITFVYEKADTKQKCKDMSKTGSIQFSMNN